jgi:negative regulator of replication initiation
MIINIKQSKYYFLTNNNDKRKNHMLEEFKDYNIT